MKANDTTNQLGIETGFQLATEIQRREFLKLSGLAAAGLLLAVGSKAAAAQAETLFEPNVFINIRSDGRIILFSKNPEIGQGIKTALPMLLAEELEVDWSAIEVQQGNLDGRFGAQFAGGSTGVKTNFVAVRSAGAAAREMLIEAAARRWQVSLDRCYALRGHIHRNDSSEKFSYAELVESASKLSDRENPPLKDPKNFRIIGQSVPGVDNHGIVTGKVEFGLDARPKGMRVAVIARCPVFGGSLKSLDESAALRVAGVEQVIRIEPTKNPTQLVAGVAVVAKNTWSAIKGRKALKIEWNLPPGEPETTESLEQLFDNNLARPGEVLRNDGNTEEAFVHCSKVHEATFDAPFLAHVPMEPQSYIADVQADKAELWGPTQVPGSVRQRAAEIASLPPSKISVRMTRVGGGFGRRLMADYACEAIYLSKALGKPVQVVWTREDDLQHDFYRPAGRFKLKAGLDADNHLVAWQVKGTTTSRYAFAGSSSPAWQTELFPDGFPAGFVKNFRMEYTLTNSLVPRGAWRAPGHNITAWVDQCFLDEMAHLAEKDPVDFRMELLGDEDKLMPYSDHGGPVYSTKRLKNVIRIAAEKSSWYTQPPKGIFRGFAAHFMFGAYIAEVVSVSIGANGAIKIEKVDAVADCGLVINRSGALNQLEGGIIDGISSAMHQAVHIVGGRADEGNFDRYTLLRMKDAPTVEVTLIDSAENPEGMGEMTLPPLAPALCNAIFAATGKRIRKLPIASGNRTTT